MSAAGLGHAAVEATGVTHPGTDVASVTDAWAVHVRWPVPGDARLAARRAHHAPFPLVPGLLARAVRPDTVSVRARYLFTSAADAENFAREQVPEVSARVQPSLAGGMAPGPSAESATAGPGLRVEQITPGSLTAPIIIAAPPRSGSTALFDALARNPDLWTVGGESEGVIEGIPALHPRIADYDSHEVPTTEADGHGPTVRTGFLADLRDALGRRWSATPADAATPTDLRGGPDPTEGSPAPETRLGPPRATMVRLLEKTPENALRLPFLLRVFPDATVIHLRRDARDTVESIVRAWRHPGFVNIPDLPGWPRGPWHLLLPPGWRAWTGDAIERIAARQWASATDAILDARRAADRWLDVAYSDLVRAPSRTVREIEEALGLPSGPRGRDNSRAATTITFRRTDRERRAPGPTTDALGEVASTVHRLAGSRAAPEPRPGMPAEARRGRTAMRRTAMAEPRSTAHGRPLFACWLHEAPGRSDGATSPGPGTEEIPRVGARPGSSPDADGELALAPDVLLQVGPTVPIPLVRRARHRDRFVADHPILWVDDPTTRVLTPFWIRFADFWTLRSLIADRPLAADIPDALRTMLAATGALSTASQHAARAERVNEALDAAAGSFATTDVCMLRHILHPAYLAALVDYYEALIEGGSWPLGDAQVPGRYGWHNESLSRFFHHQLTDVVSRVAGCPVRPAYSYVSAYRGGAVLNRHIDREQCEFTVSLLLGESGFDRSGGWPLLLESRGGLLSMVCDPGEAIMFRGPTVPHSRRPLPDGGTHTSLLFHYVPAEFRRTLY